MNSIIYERDPLLLRGHRVEIVEVNETNVDKSDICCARSKLCGEQNKKEWLKRRFSEGLKLKLLRIDDMSWGVIEYLPSEFGWRPINAPGFMLINCLRIIGKYRKMGFGSLLLNECIQDSKKMNGIVTLERNIIVTGSSKFFNKKGFQIYDSAFGLNLLAIKFKKSQSPSFFENAKKGIIPKQKGLTLVYSNQCPYIESHIAELRELADFYNIKVTEIQLKNREQSQNCYSPFDAFSMFYNGKFLLHGLNKRKLALFLEDLQN